MAQLAKSIVRLRDQVNAAHPGRSKASDGTWPSAGHRRQSPRSDHNTGHAVDFTNDPRHGFSSERFAEHLRQTRDPRLKYVISNRKIASAKTGWKWVRYNGSNAHDKHVHVSVNAHNDHGGSWSMPPVRTAMGIADIPEQMPRPETLPMQSDDDGLDESEMDGATADAQNGGPNDEGNILDAG